MSIEHSTDDKNTFEKVSPDLDVMDYSGIFHSDVKEDLAHFILGPGARDYGVTPTEIMASALVLGIARCPDVLPSSGRPTRILVDMESMGRPVSEIESLDLSQTVGWLTNILQLEFELPEIVSDELNNLTLLEYVTDCLNVLNKWRTNHSMIPNTAQGNSQPVEISDVSFNYFGFSEDALRSPGGGVFLESLGGPLGDIRSPNVPLFSGLNIDILAKGNVSAPKLNVVWRYSQRLYSREAASRISDAWIGALEDMRDLAAHRYVNFSDSLARSMDLSIGEVEEYESAFNAGGSDDALVMDVLPLTPLQQGLLFHSLLGQDEERAPYVSQLVLELGGGLDIERIERAYSRLIERHEALRVRFSHRESGEPIQVVLSSDAPVFIAHDESERNDIWSQVREREGVAFDLENSVLIECHVYPIMWGGSFLVLRMHHLILDGWSMPLLLDDLLSLYSGDSRPVSSEVRLRDFYEWLARSGSENSVSTWTGVLGDTVEPTLVAPEAGPDRPHLHVSQSFDLGSALTREVERLARDLSTTVNSVLESSWGMVLGGLTASDNVCFGEPVSGRGGSFDGVEDLLGMFINTVPVRVGLAPDRSFADVVKGVTRDRVATLDDQHVPLHELNHSLGVETLFDSLFVFENAPYLKGSHVLDSEIQFVNMYGEESTNYPLSVKVVPGDSLNVSIDYRTDCFGDSYIRSAFRAWESILRQVVANPDVAVGRVSVSSAENVASVLELGAGEAPEEAPCLVHELFERAARSGPESPAVVWDSGSMSYEELDRASNRLARRLMRAGVDVGSTVGLMLSRGPGMVVSVLASLKAGARYLPIDPELPAERIDFMLNDSTPGVLLTNPECSADVGASSGTVRLVLDEVMSAEEYAGVDDSPIVSEELSRALEVEDAAYTIYTSGSTGRPKGVVVTHRGAAALAGAQRRDLQVKSDSRVLQFASPSFDAAFFETLCAWSAGAALVVLSKPELTPGDVLGNSIHKHKVTHAVLTPTVLSVCEGEDLAGVKSLLSAAEACSLELVAKWAPGRLMLNGYGPTEATVCVSMTGSLAGWEGVVPIGRPLPGSRLYVLDSAMRPCPLGTTGELFIAGEGLARGYLGRADLTAQKFVADPFAADGSRMYRSGDLAHWGADGQIYFDGRADDQVKIRGYRIEIGEIESTLRRCHGVGQAAVVVREDQPAVRQLVGYVVPDTGGTSLDVSAIRDQLAGWLPDYMVPSVVMEVGVLPLTTNGKLDAEALPKPGDVPRADMVAAENDAEQQIMDLFAEVLGIGEVSATDSFFALGGDSITAIQLVNRAQRMNNNDLLLNHVLHGRSPRGIWERMMAADSNEAIGSDSLTTITMFRSGATGVPLVCIHPSSGNTVSYTNLANSLREDIPIIFIDAPETMARGESWSVSSLVQLYKRELLKMISAQGMMLLGWSSGGVLATELGAEMEGAGLPVHRAFLLDSYRSRFLGYSGQQIDDEDVCRLLWEERGQLWSDVPETARRDAEAFLVWASNTDATIGASDISDITYFKNNYNETIKIMRMHEERSVDFPITFFRAARDTDVDVDQSYEWSQVSRGEVEEVEIDANHNDMLSPWSVRQLVPEIEQRLIW
ncbi:non-ribosomal peptide synthetase [Kocuria sp. SL71]|uniref:non-ribosomal peptide synthetase n=1 Tax=Kocuria sp. SL71 TaxID=2995151 RepID=UPI00227353CC|nr:non-ribosomal peptide synthetase [Kocuria sp. SL71]MCY1684001.1 amino acid adenylation domain-containing protein [Kocuria sp. SL71]